MNVDLILLSLDENSPIPNWPLGQVHVVAPTIEALNDLTQRALPQSGAWLFWSADLGSPDPNLISQALSDQADLWHAGLALGMGGLPQAIDYVAPTWMLNCDPPSDIEATSWRVSLRACLVRVDVLRQMGFLRNGFHSIEVAALEWGHRCIRLGVVMRHLPALIEKQTLLPSPSFSFEDELRFVRLRFGKKWQVWASFRALISFQVRARSVFQANRRLMGELFPVESTPYRHGNRSDEFKAFDARVSVLIPTLDRYPYLAVLLTQLRSQTHPPHEVIVIDQTPLSKRRPELYNEFPDLPLKLVFLDQPGQCASRNAGLGMASGDYVLFIDDDDEVKPDLIAAHLQHLYRFDADVSSGVAHEIGAGDLPHDFTYARMSDVFPTNNSLIHRQLLHKSGLFDMAYDHGARADADVGMRMYLSGALMLLDPSISVLHHHAPRGGLRTHKARVITYASSRANLFQRHIPSATEIYLALRYFHARQVRESLWLAVFSSFRLTGPVGRRVLKIVIGLLLLPVTLLQLYRNLQRAGDLARKYPIIPTL